MVILNVDFNINRLYFINSIENIMKQIMEKYFEDEIIAKKIDEKKKIFNNIIKDKMEYITSDYFWYLNSNNCVHKFKKGKREGFMCQKKINTNIENNKKDYLCCKHSKLHVPKKRLNKKLDKIFEKSKNKSYHEKNNNIIENKIKISYINNNKNDRRRIEKKKNKKNKLKIFICNGGLIDFKDIFNNIL